MANVDNFIHCVLIPLQHHFLLLPNPTIAEVTPMPHTIDAVAERPDYWLGHYAWRDQVLPVIDLESMIGDKPKTTEDANKLCIVNGINPESHIEFYALPCYGVPQLITLNESAIQQTHDSDESNFLHCQIKIGNKIAFIPHLDNIEKDLKEQS